MKTVDQMTTETDETRHTKPDCDFPVYKVIFEKEELKPSAEKSKVVAARCVNNKAPGKSLRNLALHYGAGTYMHYTLGCVGAPFFNIMPGL